MTFYLGLNLVKEITNFLVQTEGDISLIVNMFIDRNATFPEGFKTSYYPHIAF